MKKRSLLWCLVSLLPLACGGGEGEKGNSPDDKVNYSDDAEIEERRKRLGIQAGVQKSGESTSKTVDMPAAILAREVILPECLATLQKTVKGSAYYSDVNTGTVRAECDRPDDIVEWGRNPAGGPVFRYRTENADMCHVAVCSANVATCVAERLMEIASSVAPTAIKAAVDDNVTAGSAGYFYKTTHFIRPDEVLSYPRTASEAEVKVPPQDTESVVALREEAFHYAAYAVTLAGENLRRTIGKTTDKGACAAFFSDNRPYAELSNGGSKKTVSYEENLASNLVEASLLAEEAAKKATEAHTAVADSDFARIGSLDKAARVSWMDSDISRTRAAHLLVGGGLASGAADSALGTGPTRPLSLKGKMAEDIIRLAAPSPKVLPPETVSFDDFFKGSATTNDVSVRNRLAERLGDDTLRTVEPDTFLKSRGLTRENFAEARRFISQEIKAFSRSEEATLGAIPIAGTVDANGNVVGQTTKAPIYTATATKPTPPPAVHMATEARFAMINAPDVLPPLPSDGTTSMMLLTDGKVASYGLTFDALLNDGKPSASSSVIPSPTYAVRGLAQLEDYTRSVAYEVTGAGRRSSPILAGIRRQYRIAEEQPGRIEACYRYYSPDGSTNYRDEVRLRLYYSISNPSPGVDSWPSFPAVLKGLEGLRCAIEDRNDKQGNRCNLASYKQGGAQNAPAILDDSAGFRSYYEMTFAPDLSKGMETFFVVTNTMTKEGATEKLIPGFRPKGGFKIVPKHDSPSMAYRYCFLIPIDSSAEKDVAEILEPSKEAPGRAAYSCAGIDESTKLPLEGELSQDGDAYESSWRSYLVRAKEAAERADQLGEQLIEAGLAMDHRIEGAAETLSGLCGEQASTADFFDTEPYTQEGACTTATEDKECGTNGKCVNGVCVADALSAMESRAKAGDPAAVNLVECLSDKNVEKYVSLGTEPVCIWVDGNGKICSRDTGFLGECPFPAELGPTGEYKCDYDASRVPAGLTAQKTFPLKLWKDVRTSSSEERKPMCKVLRRLREEAFPRRPGMPNPRLELVKALNNGFFAPANVAPLAARLGWEARFDDYSAITLDGVPIFSTGNPFVQAPASSGWPCVPYSGVDYATECKANGQDAELQESLFCSYTTYCGPTNDGGALIDGQVSDDRYRRATMNDRMARAVLAAKILTGVDPGDSFVAPRSHVFAYSWPKGNVADILLHDGRAVARGPIDIATGDESNDPAAGEAICTVDEGRRIAWTTLSSDRKERTPLSSYCYSPPRGFNPIVRFSPSPLSYNLDGFRVAKLWLSLDGANFNVGSASTPQASAFLAWLLAFRPSPEAADGALLAFTKHWADTNFGEKGIARGGLKNRDAIDAMELLCEAANIDPIRQGECSQPTVGELSDLGKMAGYMRCVAGNISARTEKAILVDLPNVAIDAIQESFRFKGEIGAAAGDLAASLITLKENQRRIETELFEFASDAEALKIALKRSSIAEELANIRKMSAISQNAAQCATSFISAPASVATAKGAGGVVAVTSLMSSLVVCANAMAQISFAVEEADLQIKDNALVGELATRDFKNRFREHGEVLKQVADQIDAQLLQVRSALARLDTVRERGRRELSKILLFSTDAANNHFSVNTVMRRRYNTLLVRYEAARADAVRLAAIARRAVEQRLGVRLNDLQSNMALVEAPSRWADALCTLSGIDYTRIRKEGNSGVGDYADEYIADYVRKLERVVQSYEHDFPFTDAQDTAVISLKDDVVRGQSGCQISVPNELAYSSRLDIMTDPGFKPSETSATDGESPVTQPLTIWEPVNCRPLVPLGDNTVPNSGFSELDGTGKPSRWYLNAAVPISLRTGGSLVPNGSFEQSDGGSGALGWSVASDIDGTWTRDTTVVKDGTSSVRFQVGPTADDGTWTILARRWVPVPAPGKYQLSYWYKSDQAAGSSAPNLDVWTWNNGVQTRPIRLSAPLGTNPWTRVVAPEPLVIEATTTRIDLEFITHKGIVWLDQVELVPVELSADAIGPNKWVSDDTDGVGDSLSMRLDVAQYPESESPALSSGPIQAPPPGRYRLSYWYQTDVATVAPFVSAIATKDGAITSQVQLNAQAGNHLGWENVTSSGASDELVVDSTTQYIEIYARMMGRGYFWLDKIELRPVTGDSAGIKNCISVEKLDSNVRPLGTGSAEQAPGYLVRFAPGWRYADDPGFNKSSFTRNYENRGISSALVQKVNLNGGTTYRLSFYGKFGVRLTPAMAVEIRNADGTRATVTKSSIGAKTTPNGWTRWHFLFRVPTNGDYQLAIVPPSAQLYPDDELMVSPDVYLAAFMLENIDRDVPSNVSISGIDANPYRPGRYMATTKAGTGFDQACADITGEVFRTRWTRGCTRLGGEGFDDNVKGQEFCYWELPFDVTLTGIETGGLLRQSGFAYGNYNYRLDAVAVNLVGTGIRDCSSSELPATCYSSGNIPYSITHLGPYQVRNHSGDIFEAPLFTGRIEHARALAAERYITNPISPTDKGYLEPYEHRELRGRPLTGSYKLRLWEVDGFNFNALKDVQVILDYRYWTRFQ
ncbi:MAG: hypothetical protein HY698_19515 [Deltaproteobacteria bacterium]|nr:hypothetical protein [Deltaproteobacteria bacterium]